MASILEVVNNTGTLTADDTFIHDRLVAQGHTVTYIGTTPTPSFTGINLVAMSTSALASTVGTKYDATTVPIVSFGTSCRPHSTYANSTPGGSGNTSTSWVQVAATSDGVLGGLTGANVIASATPGSAWLYYPVAQLGAGAVNVWCYGVSVVAGRSIASYVPQGAAMFTGNAPSFRALLHMQNMGLANLTTAGLAIFDGTVTTALGSVNIPPTVTMPSDQTHAVGKSGVTFTATAADTAPGTVASQAWTLATKPAGSALTTASLTGASTLTAGIVSDVPGTYQLQLIATDNQGATSTPGTVNLVAVAASATGTGGTFNVAPSPIALVATIAGVGVTGAWVQGITGTPNPQTVTIASSTSASTSFQVPSTLGTYRFHFDGTDEAGTAFTGATLTYTVATPVLGALAEEVFDGSVWV